MLIDVESKEVITCEFFAKGVSPRPEAEQHQMPSSRGYITMARRGDEVPDAPVSMSGLEKMFRQGDLGTASRRAWLSHILEQVIEHYGVRQLSYLERTAVILDAPDISATIEALSTLIAQISDDPSYLYELTGQDALSPAEIREILNVPVNLVGPQQYGDDGDDLLYLAWFLRAHQTVLQYARSSGAVVLYGHSEDSL